MIVYGLFLLFSFLLTLFFFVYGFNHYYLLRAARRYKAPDLPDMPNRPTVAIHLPVYNERYVIRRLVDACVAMAECYGLDKVTIQLLDDSSDDTSLAIDGIVEEYARKHITISVLRRGNRAGFKAGALQAALAVTEAEYIAVFDADFIPPPDFLLRTLPYFTQDEHLGIVQSRWTHLNRDFSVLTAAIALGIDVHFMIEQPGRYAAGCLQNFNGSGGVLRRTAMLQAGGWQADTLAEDLDLSYRMQNLGYRVLYLKDLHSPGEVPPTVPSFKKQQGRWACGSLRTARKLLPTLVRNPNLSWQQRFQAAIHLTGYLIHPMILLSFLLVCSITLYDIRHSFLYFNTIANLAGGLAGLLRTTPVIILQDLVGVTLLAMILVCTFAPWVAMITTLRLQNLPFGANIKSLVFMFLLGYGVSLSNTFEAVKALFTNRTWEFKRTPKYAQLGGVGAWQRSRYQVPLDFVWLSELAAVCLGVATIAIAAIHANVGALLLLLPYTAAYAFVLILTLAQSRTVKA